MKFLESYEFIGDSSLEDSDELFSFADSDKGDLSEAPQNQTPDGINQLTQDNLFNIQKISFSFEKIVDQLKQTQRLWEAEKVKGQRRQQIIGRLKTKVEVLESQNMANRKTLETSNFQITDLKKEIEESAQQNKNLKSEIDQWKQKQKAFKDNESHFRFEIERFQKLVPKLQSQIQSIQSQKQESQKSYQTLLESYFSLQSEKIELVKTLENQSHQIAELDLKNKTLSEARVQLEERVLQAKVASVSDQKIQELYKQIEQLKQQCQSVEASKVQLQNENQRHLNQLDATTRVQERMSRQLKKAEDHIESLKQSKTTLVDNLKGQLAELRTQNNILTSQMTHSEEKTKKWEKAERTILDLRSIVGEKTDRIRKLEMQIESANDQLQNEQARIEKVSDQIVKVKVNEERLQVEAQNLFRTNQELSRQLLDFEKQSAKKDLTHEKIQQEVEQLKSAKNLLEKQLQEQKYYLESATDREKSLRAEIDKVVAEKAELLKSCEDLKGQNQKISRHLSAKDQKIVNLTEQINSLNGKNSEVVDDLNQLRNQNAEMSQQLQKVSIERNHFSDQIKRLNAEKKTMASCIEKLQSSKSELTEQIQAQVKQNEDLQNQIQSMLSHKKAWALDEKRFSDLNEFADEISAKAKVVEAKEKQLLALEEELAGRQQNISSQESHFSQYVQMVNAAKQDLKNQISKMDQEIQLSLRLNPLKDYMKMTEREIDRVDLQLKKTPTLSSDRTRLETYLDDLFEQRIFLKENIRKISQDVEKRRGQLSEIYKSAALSTTPPMPPHISKESQ